MPFLSPLVLEDLDGSRWRLHEDLGYRDAAGAEVWVPAGFVTDLASIPRLVWPLLPKSGRYNKAAVVHDYLYRVPLLVAPDGSLRLLTRGQVDGVFKAAMVELGVGRVTRTVLWLAVRAGSWAIWRHYREHEAARP